MKKIITVLVLTIAFSFTTQAQKKGGKNPVDRMLKKMTTDLSLSNAQQKEIEPLLIAQMEDRKELAKNRKAMMDSGEKPSKEARNKMREERETKEAAMNTKMSQILDKEQFEKYQKMAKEIKENAPGKKMKRDN
jgi:biopolymer transport protein ExbB/TolQ